MGDGSALPVGVPVPWPLPTPPLGWLKYNGAPFDKNRFPKLGAVYPAGVLPDLRGEFIRGWDDARGVDINRVMLSWQGATAFTEYHGDGNSSTPNTNPPRNYYTNEDAISYAGTGFSAFGTINGTAGTAMANGITNYIAVRPRNVAFNYIVR
ncbi:phage tail protein, partial [Salmonella enterica subsp. enterica serovar Kokomlemle]|nr:phage tail protein [Salmonella enterica subsp. enterica serovar Kokomlemle]